MNKKIEDIWSRVSGNEMIEENGKIWFPWAGANGLVQADTVTHQAEILMRYENEPIDGVFLYSTFKKAGNKLVLGPTNAGLKIILYDLESGEAEYIDLFPVTGDRRIKLAGKFAFWKSVAYGDSVYLLGCGYPAIVKVSGITKQVTYLTDWVKQVEEKIETTYTDSGYLADSVTIGEFAYILCNCAKVVLQLNMRTDAIRLIEIEAEVDKFFGICFDGNNFWLTGYGNKVYQYDRHFHFLKRIEIFSEKERKETILFYPPLDIGDRLLLFPFMATHVYEIVKHSGEAERNAVFDPCFQKQAVKLFNIAVLSPMKTGGRIRFITGADSLWNEYDYASHSLVRYEVKTELDEELVRIKTESIRNRILPEGIWNPELGWDMTLSRFLQHLTYLPEKERKSVRQGVRVGEKIFQEVAVREHGEAYGRRSPLRIM